MNFVNGWKIEKLNDLEGLRFENIGEVKLITKHHTLNFEFNVSVIQELITNATTYISEVEKSYTSDDMFIENLKKIKTNLKLREYEFNDILYGSVETAPQNTLSRKQRALSDQDGENIKKDISLLNKTINDLIDYSQLMKNYTVNFNEHYKKTLEELGKRNSVGVVNNFHGEVERKIKAIIDLLTRQRLSSEIITLPEFNDSISKIVKNLTIQDELPYKKFIDYYFNIPVSHKVNGTVIKLQMDIPIIERTSKELYRIVEFPARNGDNLILTDAKWKYAARNSSQTMMFTDLKTCYQSDKNLFYCKLQSPLMENKANDCIVHALENRKIESKLCKAIGLKYENLIFIHLNDGQYFYYTPKNEILNISCILKDEAVSLSENTNGIIDLDPGCKAVSNGQVLIKTVKYQEAPFIKNKILSVSFNLDEVRENIKLYNTSLIDHYYIESINVFKDIVIPKVPHKISESNFNPLMGNAKPGEILVIVLLTVIAAFILNRAYAWFIRKYECKKVSQTNNKKAALDPQIHQVTAAIQSSV